jgi:ribose-phosphate pyrophosphokinase
MILFSFFKYRGIGQQLETIPSLRSGQFQISRYNNGELHGQVQGPVSSEHCIILGSIAPPDDQLFSLLLLAHTLRKERAEKITAILPYLAYCREDKVKPGESLATAWVGSLLKSSGIDEVLTIDVHSERDKQLFPIPLTSLSTAEVFAAAIKEHHLIDATIVAPDNGAIRRCNEVKSAAGMPIGETPYFEKRRTAQGIIQHGPIGRVGTRVVIVDDMLDTGGTLISACERLQEAGVKEICVFVSHGLFTETDWTKLWSLGVKRIFCTDTVPLCAGFDATRISILTIVPLLREELFSMGQPIKRIAVQSH